MGLPGRGVVPMWDRERINVVNDLRAGGRWRPVTGGRASAGHKLGASSLNLPSSCRSPLSSFLFCTMNNVNIFVPFSFRPERREV